MNPTTSEDKDYKKAKRNYLKSTRSRPPDEAFDWTPFRAAEKKFKAKFPPPDLSQVLDLSLLVSGTQGLHNYGTWKGNSTTIPLKEVGLKSSSGEDTRRRAYAIPNLPGLVLLPGYITPSKQKELISWSLRDHARWPNATNLDTHHVVPEQGVWNLASASREGGTSHDAIIHPRPMDPQDEIQPEGPRQLISNMHANTTNFEDILKEPKPKPAPAPTATPSSASKLLDKLRWANIGWFYHWGTKQYDFSREKVSVADVYRGTCKEIVESIRWEDVFLSSPDLDWGAGGPDWQSWDTSYDPDAGIVNFYHVGDTLMAHVDRSEVNTTSPLVSISLGNAAIFLIGGSTRDQDPIPILLRSGDVIVMAGPTCRASYHGVPRILDNTLPSYLQDSQAGDDWEPFKEYLQTARINVNVRQVFPKGFDPFGEVSVS